MLTFLLEDRFDLALIVEQDSDLLAPGNMHTRLGRAGASSASLLLHAHRPPHLLRASQVVIFCERA